MIESHFDGKLLVDVTPRMGYVDRRALLRSQVSEEEFLRTRQEKLNESCTVYVGNLSFYTAEVQVEEHFASCGHIADIIRGLNSKDRTPIGFCFVVFETHQGASNAVRELHHTMLDDRLISVSWDVGADSSRRWGRSMEGGQVIDWLRPNVDDGRGGLGGLRRGAVAAKAGADAAPALVEDDRVVYDWVPKLTVRGTNVTKPDKRARTW